MRIYPSPVVVIVDVMNETAPLAVGTGMPKTGNVFACAKFPRGCALLPQDGLADAITPHQVFAIARFCAANGSTVGTRERHRSFNQTKHIGQDFSCSNGACSHMDTLSGYATRPFPFVLRYLRQRLASHVVILASVVAAVACSVGTQYGVKFLVDGLSGAATLAAYGWHSFCSCR